MVSATEGLTLGVMLALIAAGAWGMHMFFGFVGVAALIAFLLPMLLLVGYLSGGSSGDARGSTPDTYKSKGASQSQED